MSGLVVDTSAAVAILISEPPGPGLAGLLAEVDERVISTGTLLELGVVLEARLGAAAPGVVDRFLRGGDIEIVDVRRAHVDRALEGWRRFGRGRHRAALNLGDLFAYALSVETGYPVLSVGEDFAATDVEVRRPAAAAISGDDEGEIPPAG